MRNHGTDPSTRGALLNEQIEALKAIWTNDEAEYHGKHVDFDPIYAWPKPVQRPYPPFYIGGESPAALNRLLKHGDGWLPRQGTEISEIKRVRSWLAENGRPDVPFTVFAARPDKRRLGEYAEAGVERVTLYLPTAPESETLTRLDELAALR
jgi:alkanesulfonate monooxygenase SsuD/methylene tetrahydromethanopterin reductase-like flavin-dependent oxidoreductase (luciferase family)